MSRFHYIPISLAPIVTALEGYAAQMDNAGDVPQTWDRCRGKLYLSQSQIGVRGTSGHSYRQSLGAIDTAS
jgi:hypothetical protein